MREGVDATASNRLNATIGELRRLDQLLQVLTAELSDMLAGPSGPEDSLWLGEAVEAMLANLDRQFDLEEQEEYLADVLERFPSWYPQIEHLQQERRVLHRQLGDIRERLRCAVDGGWPASRACRRQLGDWIAAYQSHRHRENRLLLDAFTLDVGEGE